MSDSEGSTGSHSSSAVWRTQYPNKYEYGTIMESSKVIPKWNYVAISQEEDCMSVQRIKFPVGKSKLTLLGDFAPQGKRCIRLTPNIRHNRQIEFYDSEIQDRFIKKYVSLVALQLEPNPVVFPGIEDGEVIPLNVHIEPAASDTASCTRQGSSSFVIPGLPSDHPCKLVQFSCTVVQQSHTRRPDGSWCWGPDTSIRSITIELENCVVVPQVSPQIIEHLRFTDNPTDPSQLTSHALWEDDRVQEEIATEPDFSNQPSSGLDRPQVRLTDHWIHGFDLVVTDLYTNGCVCPDVIDCKFCKGSIPDYQRLWAQQVEGLDGVDDDDDDRHSQRVIQVVPAYDESGAGDTILHDRAGYLTQAGIRWLQATDEDTLAELPSYDCVPPSTEEQLDDMLVRYNRVSWAIGLVQNSNPALLQIRGLLHDLGGQLDAISENPREAFNGRTEEIVMRLEERLLPLENAAVGQLRAYRVGMTEALLEIESLCSSPINLPSEDEHVRQIETQAREIREIYESIQQSRLINPRQVTTASTETPAHAVLSLLRDMFAKFDELATSLASAIVRETDALCGDFNLANTDELAPLSLMRMFLQLIEQRSLAGICESRDLIRRGEFLARCFELIRVKANQQQARGYSNLDIYTACERIVVSCTARRWLAELAEFRRIGQSAMPAEVSDEVKEEEDRLFAWMLALFPHCTARVSSLYALVLRIGDLADLAYQEVDGTDSLVMNSERMQQARGLADILERLSGGATRNEHRSTELQRERPDCCNPGDGEWAVRLTLERFHNTFTVQLLSDVMGSDNGQANTNPGDIVVFWGAGPVEIYGL